METVKETKEYTVFKKRNGRYGVKNAAKKWINGDEKVKILVEAGLIKVALPKPAPVEEAPAEEAATEEAPAEEATE